MTAESQRVLCVVVFKVVMPRARFICWNRQGLDFGQLRGAPGLGQRVVFPPEVHRGGGARQLGLAHRECQHAKKNCNANEEIAGELSRMPAVLFAYHGPILCRKIQGRDWH